MRSPAQSARRAVLITHSLLLAWVIAWQLVGRPTLLGLLLALLAAAPLLLPWRGLLKGHRVTHRWATLCVMPYLVMGVVEGIANPAQRGWAGACILLALAFFVALILFLRVTRPALPVSAAS